MHANRSHQPAPRPRHHRHRHAGLCSARVQPPPRRTQPVERPGEDLPGRGDPGCIHPSGPANCRGIRQLDRGC
ncbi:MAG: hypothetical protein MZV64_59880 [Ignavibacteriales bacterium]|nr:hypothetical protein [Ignavibacteriales bacterium]